MYIIYEKHITYTWKAEDIEYVENIFAIFIRNIRQVSFEKNSSHRTANIISDHHF